MPSLYYRPDGVSLYYRPDGVSLYYRYDPLSVNLVAQFRLQEDAGDPPLDESANDNDGTIVGNVAQETAGLGTALIRAYTFFGAT